MTSTDQFTADSRYLLRRELNRQTKASLVAMYKRLGGLGGLYPPEKWRKDEIIDSIIRALEARRAREAERDPFDGILS